MSDTDLSLEDELALAIGRATMAWTGAHQMVFLIFSLISGMRHQAAEGIFFALKSDAAQREITREAAKAVFSGPNQEEKRDELLSLLKQLGDFAAERNKTVHTMWSVLHIQVPDGPARHMLPMMTLKNMVDLMTDPPTDYAAKFNELAVRLSVISGGLKAFYFDLVRQDRSTEEQINKQREEALVRLGKPGTIPSPAE